MIHFVKITPTSLFFSNFGFDKLSASPTFARGQLKNYTEIHQSRTKHRFWYWYAQLNALFVKPPPPFK